MDENKKTYKIYKIIMLVAITAFITFFITSVCIYSYMKKEGNILVISNSDSKIDKEVEKYKKIIDEYYLEDVDEDELIEGAIKGYISALGDPYTEYISAENMEDYTETLLGNFVGIGIYMVKDTKSDRIAVLSPIKESPAEAAGIQPGDLIIKVNDVEYRADDMTEASNIIKGEVGTEVKLEILRGTETLTFTIKREEINTNPVIAEVLEENIGYIQVSSFDEGTAEDFKHKFEQLQKENIKSLVIDLRNNGGGLVEEALKIADYIAEKDSTLLITNDKNDKKETTKAKENPIINMPIAILVNGNTASASEILAGALKDLGKATLVGEKTYGKGVIQQFLTLNDGSGIKITTEEYFTPNETKINKVGIEPNEVVELPENVESELIVKREEDTQLNKALEILKK